MTTAQAIEKAVAGGWKPKKVSVNGYLRFLMRKGTGFPPLMLDPAFWRALGKTEGWEEYAYLPCELPRPDGVEKHEAKYCKWVDGWRVRQQEMLVHLAEGGTIESYFQML